MPPVGDELGWRADFSDIYVRKQLLGSGAYGEVRACAGDISRAWPLDYHCSAH